MHPSQEDTTLDLGSVVADDISPHIVLSTQFIKESIKARGLIVRGQKLVFIELSSSVILHAQVDRIFTKALKCGESVKSQSGETRPEKCSC